MDNHLVKIIIDDKGREFCIAALIDGSIGYYSPDSADNMLRHIERGDKWFAERTMACFNGDGLAEFWYDIKRFIRIETDDFDKVKRLVNFVKLSLGKMSTEKSMAFSSLYPTMGI